MGSRRRYKETNSTVLKPLANDISVREKKPVFDNSISMFESRKDISRNWYNDDFTPNYNFSDYAKQVNDRIILTTGSCWNTKNLDEAMYVLINL